MVIDIHDNHHDARTGRFTEKDTRHLDTDMTGRGFDQAFLDVDTAEPEGRRALRAALDRVTPDGRYTVKELNLMRSTSDRDAIRMLMDAHDTRVNMALAANPHLDERDLRRLIHDAKGVSERERVYAGLCSNPDLPARVNDACLDTALGRDRDPLPVKSRIRVGKALARHTDAATARLLLRDARPEVAAAACANHRLDDATLAMAVRRTEDANALDDALANPNCGADTVDAVIHNPDSTPRQVEDAYAHPNADPDTLRTSQYLSAPKGARTGAARNPKLTRHHAMNRK